MERQKYRCGAFRSWKSWGGAEVQAVQEVGSVPGQVGADDATLIGAVSRRVRKALRSLHSGPLICTACHTAGGLPASLMVALYHPFVLIGHCLFPFVQYRTFIHSFFQLYKLVTLLFSNLYCLSYCWWASRLPVLQWVAGYHSFLLLLTLLFYIVQSICTACHSATVLVAFPPPCFPNNGMYHSFVLLNTLLFICTNPLYCLLHCSFPFVQSICTACRTACKVWGGDIASRLKHENRNGRAGQAPNPEGAKP
jgi:hypothetical protein